MVQATAPATHWTQQQRCYDVSSTLMLTCTSTQVGSFLLHADDDHARHCIIGTCMLAYLSTHICGLLLAISSHQGFDQLMFALLSCNRSISYMMMMMHVLRCHALMSSTKCHAHSAHPVMHVGQFVFAVYACRGVIPDSFANWTVLQGLEITNTKMRAEQANAAGINLPSFLVLDRYTILLAICGLHTPVRLNWKHEWSSTADCSPTVLQ